MQRQQTLMIYIVNAHLVCVLQLWTKKNIDPRYSDTWIEGRRYTHALVPESCSFGRKERHPLDHLNQFWKCNVMNNMIYNYNVLSLLSNVKRHQKKSLSESETMALKKKKT